MSDINQLKHFDALNYKGEYFTFVLVLIVVLLIQFLNVKDNG